MYLNFKEYSSKNQRFLNEGIFDVFMNEKSETALFKFRKFLRDEMKSCKILEYTYTNDRFQTGNKSYYRINLKDDAILELIKMHKVIYFSDYQKFLYVPDIDLSNHSFLDRSKAEKNSLTLAEIKKKFS